MDGIGPTTGGAAWGLYQQVNKVARDSNPYTCQTIEVLRQWGGFRNTPPQVAGKARLTWRLWADAGCTFATGARAVRGDGVLYQALADYAWAVYGYKDIALEAVAVGSSGNCDVGTQLNVVSPQPGMQSAGVVQAIVAVAADDEQPTAYQPRVIAAYQGAGVGGGTLADWEHWAEEVDGVFHAITSSPGIGRISVVVQGPGPSAPDPALVTEVETYLRTRYAGAEITLAVTGWVP